MIEQTAATTPASLSPELVDEVAHAPPGCLRYREVGGVTEMWWTEEGTSPRTEKQVVVLPVKVSIGSTKAATHPAVGAALGEISSPVHLKIDSFIPTELLLLALAALAPSLASLDYYEESLRDLEFEARFSAALAPSLPSLRRLRLVHNPSLELLPLDAPAQPPPSLSPFYQLLPQFRQLTHFSTTCIRNLAPGAFQFLPGSLEHLRIEVLRPCAGVSVPDAVLASLRDGSTPVQSLRRFTIMDDDTEGWEGLESELVEVAKGRGIAFERIGEVDVDVTLLEL